MNLEYDDEFLESDPANQLRYAMQAIKAPSPGLLFALQELGYTASERSIIPAVDHFTHSEWGAVYRLLEVAKQYENGVVPDNLRV